MITCMHVLNFFPRPKLLTSTWKDDDAWWGNIRHLSQRKSFWKNTDAFLLSSIIFHNTSSRDNLQKNDQVILSTLIFLEYAWKNF